MKRCLPFVVAVVAVLVTASAAPAATHEFTDWSSRDSLKTFGTLQGRNVVLTSPEVVGGNVFDGSSTQWSSALYTPSLPYSDQIEIVGRNGNSYTLDLGGPTKDPIFHLYSLASTVTFPSGTTVTKLSGQDTFTASGNTVSGTAQGSEDSSGTVRVSGTFSSLTFSVVPTFGDGSQADGISLHVGFRLAVPSPTTTVNLGEPQPGGYYAYLALVSVSASGHPDGAPIETRCVLDPAAAPAGFDDIPPGCAWLGRADFVGGVGTHTMYAASRNATGETEAVVARPFRIEIPPDTFITEAPPSSSWAAAPRFAFGSSAPGSTFECRLDGAPFAPCSSPLTSPVLQSGPHAFEVRATDPRGIPDPIPARAEFTLNEKAIKRGSCEVRSVVLPVAMLRLQEPEHTTCAIGTLPGSGCPRDLVCVVRDERCPRGAVCTLTMRAEWFDADLNFNWVARARTGYGPVRDFNQPGYAPRPHEPGTPSTSYPYKEASCETGRDGDRCVATAEVTSVGEDVPFYAACGAYWTVGSGVYGRTVFREDSIRRIECDAQLKIEPARPLSPVGAAVLLGLMQTQVSAPGPGTMSLAASILAAAGKARAAAKAKPKIATQTQTVTAAGPVPFALKLNAAAKRLLKRKKKLAVDLRATFAPTDGAAPTVKTTRVTIRQPKPALRRCKSRRQRGC